MKVTNIKIEEQLFKFGSEIDQNKIYELHKLKGKTQYLNICREHSFFIILF